MNYTSNSLPEAYVSVGRNKSRLKIYNGKNVFIKDGEEFQIELFNPTTRTIGAKILINGNSISSSLLVIKPGERSYLERYLDDNRKFQFETYNVENSKEVKEAIKKNGEVRIEFYNEKTPAINLTTVYPTYTYLNYPYYINPTITIAPSNIYFGTTGGCVPNTSTIISTASGLSGTISVSSGFFTSGTTGNASSNSFYCSSTPTSGLSAPIVTTNNCDMSQTADSNTLETGRIEKGATSDQSFSSYYGDFETYYFTSKEYKLLPESQKPVEVKDIRQYCPGCRTRVKKSSWKFCPSCGESLD